MVKVLQSLVVLLGVWAVAQPLVTSPVEAQLSPYFYGTTCPSVFSIVAEGVFQAILNETRNAASLLRLHFHDCFVQGCDGSVLLDSTPTSPSEKTSIPNKNSLRAFGVIDTIKAQLETACPNVVSCADVVALCAFFSVILSGGPPWVVPLGRRDSFLANFNLTINLPGPASNVTALKAKFANQNLTTTDLVALSGGHTIGLARCAAITSRLYNFSSTSPSDPTINSTLLKALKKSCPFGGDGNVTNDLDIQTPTVFDNLYFINLLSGNGIFQSDEVLFTGENDTKTLVQTYATNKAKFYSDFAAGMIKMGNLHPLTGTAGEVRKNCHVRNAVTEEESSAETEVEGFVEEFVEQKMEGAKEYIELMVKQAKDSILAKQLQKLAEKIVEDTIEENDSIGESHSAM